MGFIELDIVPAIFYLFICIWSKKSALVQLINYQLWNLLLSLKLKNHMLETSNQELLIWALGDLTTSSLAWLPASNPRGQYENVFY